MSKERLQRISATSTIRQYAQGVSQNMVKNTLGSFIAPSVNVATLFGGYKIYNAKNAYRVPQTLRKPGERATRIGFDASDGTYQIRPHAIDCPVDYLETMSDSQTESLFKESSNLVAEIAALAHEMNVIDIATSTAKKSNATWKADADPIDDLDGIVLDIMKNTGLGGNMAVRMAFGASTWRIFKNHKNVIARLNGTKRDTSVPTFADLKETVLGNPDARICYGLSDKSPEGKAKELDFLLDDKILIFIANDNPTRYDPSFMKTFRLDGEWMKPGSYSSEDGRGEVAKMDWAEDVRITNEAAAVLLTVKTA